MARPLTPREDRADRPEYRPFCLRDLQAELGASDATSEWIEVAVKHLIHTHENEGVTATDELAARYNRPVRNLDTAELSATWARLQVLTVHQFVEWFLDSLLDEHPRVLQKRRKVEGREEEDISRTNQDGLLDFTLAVLDVERADVGELECEIIEYYRGIRNHIVHPPTAAQKDASLAERQRLRQQTMPPRYAQLEAPNTLHELSFDDFVLFARTLQRVARTICAASMPTDEELLLMIREDTVLTTTLKRSAPTKVAAKLERYLRSNFGFPETAPYVTVRLLEMGLLA